jgi:acetyl/propionyl-CoA carboxylase alpha subunit
MKKILIANRSEIASRIIFTCKTLEIKTACIYSQEDRLLPYVYQADEAYALHESGYQAYTNQDNIIQIALKAKADAIHPGYGFLSENAGFAQKVIDSGLIWIGPSPACIDLMGNKIKAKEIMAKSNVPVIPGFSIFKDSKEKEIQEKAEKIGFPVLLKDPWGGGGKAIKKVHAQNELSEALSSIKTEAKKLTGSEDIILEKYIEKGRHVEIQVAGDGQNFIHLYERECSIQRRHQKIIEETPCNFVEAKILEQMYKAAICAARTIRYNNIGTVEFIVTPDQNFYFLEMNTRLQVEHSITEMTTGIDLIALQIELAQIQKLKYKQHEISEQNHAIECRIYSEDTQNNFTPSTGIIKNLQVPAGPFLRIDHNLEENQNITPLYDPMIAKITTLGNDRGMAIKNMLNVLKNFKIDGIKTNIHFLQSILNSDEFLNGKIHTQLLNENFLEKMSTQKSDLETSETEICLIAAALFDEKQINIYKTKDQKVANINNNWKMQQWE